MRRRLARLQLHHLLVFGFILAGVGLCYYLAAYSRSATTGQLKIPTSAARAVGSSVKAPLPRSPVASNQRVLVRSWRTVHQQLESAPAPIGAAASRQAASWQLSWQSCMHGWRHRLWTEADNERLVRDSAPWFRSTYRLLTKRSERLVASRYLYLYVHGGVYADLDSRCLRSFEHLLVDCGVALSASSGSGGNIATNFLFSKPGHQLWLRLLKLIHDIAWRRQSLPPGVTSVADGRLLARTVERTLHTFKDGGSSRRVCVMPASYFAPPVSYEADGSGCQPWLRMTDKDLTRCEGANIRSYVLHLPMRMDED